MAWVFLTKSKEPPCDIVRAFLTLHGHSDGWCVCTDQGRESASSGAFRDVGLQTSVEVFFAEFVNVHMAINFDIVAGLCDIDTIEHVKETLPFEGYPEFIIDHVEEDVCSFLVRGGDGGVVDLPAIVPE